MKIRELFTARDMTEGAPWRRIMEFALPMLLGNIAQQLYNTVDTVVVGKYVGDNALSAVGSAFPILNLMLAVLVGVATGAGIVVSQNYGARDRKELSVSIGNCIILAVIGTLIIMVVGPLVTMPFLQMLGTPESIIYWCRDYLMISFVGVVGFFFYNMLAGIMRGLGDSISALLFLVVAALLNVGLDLLFVIEFDMGVAGVALATVIAQTVSALLCLWKLLRMKDVFDLNWETLRFVPRVAGRILRIGIPSGVTQGMIATAGMIVQNLTNALGETVIACSVIVMRVDGFAMLPNMSFGQAMSVYTGQNVGAAQYDRVRQGVRQGGLMAFAFSTTVTAVLLLFGRFLFDIFTDTQGLIDLAVQMMQVLAVGYICMAVSQVLGGVMRGAGDTVTPMWISIVSTIILRVPMAYLFAYLTRTEEYPKGKPIALFGSLMVSWVLGMIMHLVAFRLGKWKDKMYRSGQEVQRRAEAQ